MSTSGSVSFSVSRDDLIKAALQQIGAIGEGDTPTANQTTEAALLLNMIVKARMADGMPLWALKQGYILPTTGVSSVTLGPSGGHATLSYVSTTTTADAAAAATTITVSSVSGIANGYYIGIELDSGDMQWTTVNGAPAGLVVTLTAALTGAATSGARVYAYQTKIQRPLRIISAYAYNTPGGTRYPINMIAKDQYYSLGAPSSTGTPNQAYYDPQLDNGVFYVYPRFQGGDTVIEVTFHRPFEDFVASTDTPDFPQEWYLPLFKELSALLGPKYGVTIDERRNLFAEAKMYRDLALENGTPQESIFLEPNVSRTG